LRHKKHWTRHPKRLDREYSRKSFGDEGYAMEELVAELGSAFPCADLELTPEIRDDHASYIGSWIKVLKSDTRPLHRRSACAARGGFFAWTAGAGAAAGLMRPVLISLERWRHSLAATADRSKIIVFRLD
jgi:antirestriction protein ArdC